MPVVGEVITSGRLPGERIASTVETTDSAAWDDDPAVALISVTAALVSGRVYRVTFHADIEGSIAASTHYISVHEDTLSGKIIDFRRFRAHTTDNFPYHTEVEYTAVATGNKTFVVTGVRESGTGLGFRRSSSTAPGYLYVDFIRAA